MSVPVALGAIGLLGAGASALAMNSMMKNMNSGNTSNLQALSQQNAQNAVDTLPTAPEAPTGNADDAGTNEAEAERQRQLAAMAANDKAFNPTSGLGVTSTPTTKKKTLGGTA